MNESVVLYIEPPGSVRSKRETAVFPLELTPCGSSPCFQRGLVWAGRKVTGKGRKNAESVYVFELRVLFERIILQGLLLWGLFWQELL